MDKYQHCFFVQCWWKRWSFPSQWRSDFISGAFYGANIPSSPGFPAQIQSATKRRRAKRRLLVFVSGVISRRFCLSVQIKVLFPSLVPPYWFVCFTQLLRLKTKGILNKLRPDEADSVRTKSKVVRNWMCWHQFHGSNRNHTYYGILWWDICASQSDWDLLGLKSAGFVLISQTFCGALGEIRIIIFLWILLHKVFTPSSLEQIDV